MAGIPIEGPILFSQLQAEFGGENPVYLSEYFGDGDLANGVAGIPTRGEGQGIRLGVFRGKAKVRGVRLLPSSGSFFTSAFRNGSNNIALFGANDVGQLGAGDCNYRTYVAPYVIGATEPFVEDSIMNISLGWQHSAAVTKSGKLYTWGRNSNGACGVPGVNVNLHAPVMHTDFSNAVDVSCGMHHTLVVLGDGTVRGFGLNNFGQLGDGTLVSRSTHQAVLGLSNVTLARAGVFSSIAQTADGSVVRWGCPTQLRSNAPMTAPSNMPQLSGASQLELATHGAALVGTSVYTWGDNTFGQLGTSNTTPSLVPVAAPAMQQLGGSVMPPARVSAGWHKTAVATSGGQLWAVGDNALASITGSTSSASGTAVLWPHLVDIGVTDVTAGAASLLYVASNAPAGRGRVAPSTSNALPAAFTSTRLAAQPAAWRSSGRMGMGHSLVLDTWGRPQMAGTNSNGELGEAAAVQSRTTLQTRAPGAASNLIGIVAAASGASHSLALRHDGTVWGWGKNLWGQAIPSSNAVYRQVQREPVQVLGLSNVVQVACGGGDTASHSHCAVWKTPGTYTFRAPPGVSNVSIVCIGGGGSGGLATYVHTDIMSGRCYGGGGGGGGALAYTNNVAVTPGSTLTVVVASGGLNLSPVQTSMSTNASYYPTQRGNDGGFSRVQNAAAQTVCLAAGGKAPTSTSGGGQGGSTADCVGSVLNSGGVGGSGADIVANYDGGIFIAGISGGAGGGSGGGGGSGVAPTSVPTHYTYAGGSGGGGAGGYGVAGGSAFGNNNLQPLYPTNGGGTDVFGNKVRPSDSTGPGGGGGGCTCVSWVNTTNGTRNQFMQYGTNGSAGAVAIFWSDTTRTLPSGVVVSDTAAHSLALQADGTVWQWGTYSAQRGKDNGALFPDAPEMVAGLSNIVQVSTLYDHHMALTSNGAVLAWGANSTYQLGNARTVASATPVLAWGAPSNAVAVAAGGEFSMALESSGQVWECGGITAVTRLFTGGTTFIPMPGMSNMVAINATRTTRVALRSDGTVWTWGNNVSSNALTATASAFNASTAGMVFAASSGAGASEAFDFNITGTSTSDRWQSASGLAASNFTFAGASSNASVSGLAWLRATLPVGSTRTPARYVLWSGAYAENPTAWTLLGMDASSNWSVLDRRSNIAWPPNSTNGTYNRSFTIASPVATRSFMFVVQGVVTGTQANVQELQFYNEPEDAFAPPRLNVGLSNIVAISAGHAEFYALRSDGAIFSWGNNANGQLGIGTTISQPNPVQLSPGASFI